MHQHPEPARRVRSVAAEARLSAYFADVAEQRDRRYVSYALHHPRETLRAFRDLGALPLLQVAVGGGLEGGLVAHGLPVQASGPRSLAAALALPSTPAAFSEGSSKQTLRRKTRVAEKAGVVWSTVDSRAERTRLLRIANEHERSHPLAAYRRPPGANDELLDVDLWLVARAADGRPLIVSITPVHGTAALLGMFRALEVTDEASAARYLMTKVLAEHLVARGVTHLFDAVHPLHLTNGLRHFQRMVGFRLVRVQKVPEAAPVRV